MDAGLTRFHRPTTTPSQIFAYAAGQKVSCTLRSEQIRRIDCFVLASVSGRPTFVICGESLSVTVELLISQLPVFGRMNRCHLVTYVVA